MLKRLIRLIRKLPPIDQASMVLLALLLAYAATAGKTSAAILPTSATKAAMIRPVLKSMVTEKHLSEAVSSPTDKRAFVMPKFWGVVRLHCPTWLWGVVGQKGNLRRTASDVFFTIHAPPYALKNANGGFLVTPEGAKTMNQSFTPAQAAPVSASTHEAALIQLHAAASNAATLARWYTTQHKYEAAARKTRQHLQALRQLAKLEATSATKGGLHHA